MPSQCCCSSNQIIGLDQQHTACSTPLEISLRKLFHCLLDVGLLTTAWSLWTSSVYLSNLVDIKEIPLRLMTGVHISIKHNKQVVWKYTMQFTGTHLKRFNLRSLVLSGWLFNLFNDFLQTPSMQIATRRWHNFTNDSFYRLLAMLMHVFVVQHLFWLMKHVKIKRRGNYLVLNLVMHSCMNAPQSQWPGKSLHLHLYG